MSTILRCVLAGILLLPIPGAIAQEDRSPLEDANTKFAFHVFHQLEQREVGKNILIAPAAISLDFALLQNGASDEARQEMLQGLEFENLSTKQINEQSAILLNTFSYPQFPRDKRSGFQKANDHLVISRSLWAPTKIKFRSSFLTTAKQFYEVIPKMLPVNDETASHDINNWVAQRTGGNIQVNIPPIHGDKFFLISTAWFKGFWFDPFDPKMTHDGDFAVLGGAHKSVPMMSKSREFGYLSQPEFQAVCLDYSNTRMLVFLPAENSSLMEFEKLITPENWKLWLQQMHARQGYLELPRFTAEYEGDITGMLEQMGVKTIFHSLQAFSPAVVNPEGAELVHVMELVKLKVDEKGTEISSVGIYGGVVGGVGQQPELPFRMIVNRPFFFAVLDNKTDAILYMGTIVNPTNSNP